MRYIIIILIGFFSLPTFAQKNKSTLNYQQNIKKAQQQKDPLSLTEMEELANSYRMTNDTYNAERWYAQIIDQSAKPENMLYYAQALHSNGKYEKAKKYYLKYDELLGRSGNSYGNQLISAVNRVAEVEFPGEVLVENMTQVNSDKLDYSPVFFENGIAFVSNREMEKGEGVKDQWTGENYSTLYFSAQNAEGQLAEPELIDGNLIGKYHEGPLSFIRGGSQVFFTKNVSKRGKDKVIQLKIFTAYSSGDEWSEPKKIELGQPTSSEMHPAVSPDGLFMVFSSDMEGGMGGMDLYVSEFSSGQWTEPQNLGSEINTAGNEVFPFIYDDGTLYFASDSRNGLGGLDIFYADKKEIYEWENAKNLGSPFNSNKDDFGYILNVLGTEGYFTSGRYGGLGKDDIYKFTLKGPQSNKSKPTFKEICVRDPQTGNPIVGANISFTEMNGNDSEMDLVLKLDPTENEGEYSLRFKQKDPFAIEEEPKKFTTDENGIARIPVESGKEYFFLVRKAGFSELKQKVESSEILNAPDGSYCLEMFASNCAKLEGVVQNKNYQNGIPGATVILTNLCTGEMQTQKTNAQGLYQFSCVPCQCDYILKVSKTNFLENNDLFSTIEDCTPGQIFQKDLLLTPAFNADGTPVAAYEGNKNLPGNMEEMFEAGIVIDLDIIYFDFDDFNIRSEATSKLNEMVKLLSRTPNLNATLLGHTDSRGPYEYNMKLSQNRAEAAMFYLINMGIESERLGAEGFGESKHLNDCGDNSNCSESQHQQNRRTEIRIYKKVDN